MKELVIAISLTILSANAALADQKCMYGLRETVGSVEIHGWERGLCQGNPNLSHWHWTPMYANIQRVRTYSDPSADQAHAAMPHEVNIPPPHYVKPIQVPLPVPKWATEMPQLGKLPAKPASDVNASSHSTLSGKFLNKTNAPSVASYGGDYTRANAPGLLTDRAVRGRMMAGQHI